MEIAMIVSSRSREDNGAYLPTPDQIDAMTAEIRETWSPGERRRRDPAVVHFEVSQMPSQPRRKGYEENLTF